MDVSLFTRKVRFPKVEINTVFLFNNQEWEKKDEKGGIRTSDGKYMSFKVYNVVKGKSFTKTYDYPFRACDEGLSAQRYSCLIRNIDIIGNKIIEDIQKHGI